MTSQDGLALLKQMHQRGEITDEQYDTLRRHVLWGTPLPDVADGVPAPRPPAEPAAGYIPGAATVGPSRSPDPPDRYSPDPRDRYPERSGPYPGPPGRQLEPRDRISGPPGRYPDQRDLAPNPRSRYAEPRSRFPEPPDRVADPPGRYPHPGRFPAEPVGGYPADPVPPPAPRRYGSRRERREAEEARAQAAYPRPAASTGPLPPVREAPPRRRHRRDDGDIPPPATSPPDSLPLNRPPPDDPTPARRRRHAPPEELTPRRGRRPADPEPDHRHGLAPPDEVPPRRGRPADPEPHHRHRLAPPDEVTGRSHRPAEPQPDLRRDAAPEEVTPWRSRRRAEADRWHAPPEEVAPRRGRRPVESEPEADRRGRRGGDPGKQKRRPRRRSVVAVLTSVVLALALAAGGVYWFELRRQGLAPPAYARQACGAVRDWQQTVDSSNARLVTQISRQQNKTTIRSDVTAYYTTIAGGTDQLRVAILDLGAADLTGGREYADSLAAAVGDQASALRRLAGQAGRLDPATATFQTDLQGVLTGADAAVSAVTAALARPAAGITTELRTTLSNEPACAPYVG